MEFTADGIVDAIKEEIHDELKIDKEDLENLSLKNVIAAYRDIVEGNKPQLLFYYRVNKDHQEVERNFVEKLAEKRSKDGKRYKSIEDQKEEDGKRLLWIDIDELDNITYLQSAMIVNGRRISSVPSATVSLIAFKQYCDNLDLGLI